MTKGMHFGEPDGKIEYLKKPRDIVVVKSGSHHMCDNCAACGDFPAFIIKMNDTDYADESGSIMSKRVAKEREIWLCSDCFEELKLAMQNVKEEER